MRPPEARARAAVLRPPGVTWGSMPSQLPSTWMVSLLASCPPRLTHAPASASAFRTTLDSDSRNVASASSLSSTGIALSNGPISVILGLNPGIGPTTGKDWPRARWSWGRHKRLTNQTLVVAQGRAEGVLINGPGEREKRQAITVNIATTLGWRLHPQRTFGPYVTPHGAMTSSKRSEVTAVLVSAA